MQAYQFTVTIKVEHPENFICDNDDIARIIKCGLLYDCNGLGEIEVEAEEQE